MKLTWFGGRTVRVHIGGAILVGEAEGAPVGVDRGELASGTDRSFTFMDGPECIAAEWKPRKALTALQDDGGTMEVLVWRIAQAAVLVDAAGEPPLVLADGKVPPLGRWARDAVVVLFGEDESLTEHGTALLQTVAPRLVVLAAKEAAIDAAVPVLMPLLDGSGLMALEPGMALEV